LGGIFTLRSRNDAAALRAAIKRGPRRVLIVGAGLIGSEAASSCHDLGLSVTLVDPHPTPLARAIGTVMGEILVDRLAEAGIDFRPGFHVRSFEGGAGHIRRAYLSNGRAVETDCVIVALGATRDTSWLADAGLLANGNGITCDGACRALDSDGTPIRDIYVAGDAARWPSSIYDNRLISVEHWGNAVEQAAHAARNMLTPDEEQASYQHLPAYWSSQFGTNIKVVGLPPGADKVAVVQGSRESRRLLAAYGKAGRTIAAVSFDEARWLPAYAERIVSRHPFPPISGASDQPPFAELAPGFPAQFGQELLEQKSSKL
jgi:NADPH-dependent 2,4-dienoyl-CoA reductase/sulfur reductase-like enzyme